MTYDLLRFFLIFVAVGMIDVHIKHEQILNNDCMGKNFRFHAALNALFLTDFLFLALCDVIKSRCPYMIISSAQR